ncbi:MAG: peptidase lon domain protein [Frankiales bacterium]|nr:peptidase lon domain protein [Frankiales bacterium]
MAVLPLFPLGLVLFPGLVLPLHVFEERYRDMIRDLLELPEQERQFGVLAIREGRETGVDGISALYEVGCTARLREVESYEDGRFDLVTVGTELFRLKELHTDRTYFTGDVEWLPDEVGDAQEADVLAASVGVAFVEYLEALGAASNQEIEAPELPDDPLVLSHLVAATMLLDLADRQELLAQADGRTRLRRELSVLRREGGFLRTLTAAPAPELSRTPVSLN